MFTKLIQRRVEKRRAQAELAKVERRNRPGEHADELAELTHAREVQKLRAEWKTEDRTAARTRWARAWGGGFTRLGGGIVALMAWLTGRWVVVRGWVADRVVVVPVLVAGGAALYGQYSYLTDPTAPQHYGDTTGMGWPALVALLAGLAVEVMAFTLFRAAKRGRDNGDDVRLETTAGWSIVAGAVWFNAWHVDPLAGFLSAIGPIAWEVRERRERRNREIAQGVRGRAPIPMPRPGLLFARHYPREYRAMLRTALWERARLSYPALVAQIEHDDAARALTASVDGLADLVRAPVPDGPVIVPGTDTEQSQSVMPGTNAVPGTNGRHADPATHAVPGTDGAAQPVTVPGTNGRHAAVPVTVTITKTPGTAGSTDPAATYPAWKDMHVTARHDAVMPVTVPGTDTRHGVPGTNGTAVTTTRPGTTVPGTTTAAVMPGTTVTATDTRQPGTGTVPGTNTAVTGAAVPGTDSAGTGADSRTVMPGTETDMEQTRPMPRLVPDLVPGTDDADDADTAPRLAAVPDADDRQLIDQLVAAGLELVEKSDSWPGRDRLLVYLRKDKNMQVPGRLVGPWWQQMREYRAAV